MRASAALQRHLPDVDQLLILAAGLDTRYSGSQRIAAVAPGSSVAFDYLSSQLIEGKSLFMRYARRRVFAVAVVLTRMAV